MESYGYGLNVILDARVDALANNSKRVMQDFQLTSITMTFSNTAGGYDDGTAFILGTENQLWFNDYVIASTIFGDAALPHFLPGDGTLVKKGDFIVVISRNLTAVEKHISLLFQGYHRAAAVENSGMVYPISQQSCK